MTRLTANGDTERSKAKGETMRLCATTLTDRLANGMTTVRSPGAGPPSSEPDMPTPEIGGSENAE
jgi:hypothetical protein